MNSNDFKNAIEEVDTVYGRISFFRNDLYLGRSLREYGEWAQKELDFLRSLIEDGSVVVDAGAFIGTHTMAFSSFVGPLGRVYSFEPHPTSFRLLQRNVESNKLTNVEIFNTGLCEKSGLMSIEEHDLLAPNSLGSLRLGEIDSKSNMVTVEVTTLDELGLDACHLIKIDVEGMESQVLSGGKATIERHQPYVYAECNSADDGWPVVLMMRSLGYHVYVYSEVAYNSRNFRKNSLNIFGNARELALICVPPHLHDAFKRLLSPGLDVIRIDRLDDLVLCLIKKPQYKQEILANANGVSYWGNDFWKNEGELDYIAERDGQIARLNQLVTERDSQIASLNQGVTERDSQIASLNQGVTERDSQIASLNHALAQRQAEYQCHVAELENAVWAEQQRSVIQVGKLRQELDKVMKSRSWRVTALLGKVMTFVHEMPRQASAKLLTMYRTLPITTAQRRRLKEFLFTVFGFAFARMDAYKRWKEYRQIQVEWPAAAPVEQITTLAASVTPRAMHALSTADGTWEWADYDAVKSRIVQVKGSQLAQVASTALSMIDIGSEPFASAAARVRLPAPPDMPDVSIILPVFNNLKFTLESLLSISSHTDGRTSFEIILADDASTDETAQFVGKIANLRVIRNEQNIGFLRNCNKALEHVRGRYVLYLNNDVQVTPGWLANLHETFSTQHNVGAAGARFVYPSGHLQEAGVAFRHDGTADMVGLNDDAARPRYNYIRRVDYISGACLMIPTDLARKLGGFSEDFLPCYCEDSDLCLRVQAAGYHVYYNPAVTIIHHLSKTTAAFDLDFKLKSIAANLVKLQHKWVDHLDRVSTPKVIAFYLPQFHPFPENDSWWGAGFTEWTNVTKAQPNFIGHYQPRLPADLGFYDLRLAEVMQQQAELARRYGIHGFCFYYYWFGGKRLLEQPIEQMLATGEPDMPFCLCWANENWTRRWDGQDQEILMGQNYSAEDDIAVINDLIRFFRDPRYIRIDGRPMILVYRVTLFPDFCATVARWRNVSRDQGIGEIYVAMVESMELVHANKHPREFGCDAAVEFPPLGMAEQKPPSGEIINPEFAGAVADYRDIAVRFATREFPGYTRFKGVMPGWDNTARRQNNSFCFEHATPGTFQAWLEESIEQTRQQHYGDERMVFINAWNEWAEGAYLEPDRRFGHTYLEAVKNATEASRLLRRNKYWHSN